MCRPTDHLFNVLLPPSFHLLSEIWLYQQQALGRTVSVSLLIVFKDQLRCCSDVSHDPWLCTDDPSTWQTLVKHMILLWWQWLRAKCNGLPRGNVLITAKYVSVCVCVCVSCCSLACLCHSLHYIKRILETMFVHRISHGTMPLRNIFKVSGLHNFDLWMWCTVYYYIVLHCYLRNLSPIYVEPYYSPSFYSRTVAITGARQLGWHTTLTTLSIQHPVSDHCIFQIHSSVDVDLHLNPFFCDTSTDYGQQQVNTGLYIFLVSLISF